MKNEEIDKAVRENDYVLTASLYISICQSNQVDHVKRNGDAFDIWTTDGWHWKVQVYPD